MAGCGVGVRVGGSCSAWWASSAAMEGPREGWRELGEDQSLREVEGGESGREKVLMVLSVMEETCGPALSNHSRCT